MFYNFAKNLCKALFRAEFQLVTANSREETSLSEQTDFVVLSKNMSPVLYILSVVNIEKMPLPAYQQIIQPFLDRLTERLPDYRCNHIICVHILAGATISDSLEPLLSSPPLPGEKTNQVFWHADLHTNTLNIAPGAPSKILQIQDAVQEAFFTEGQLESPTNACSLNYLEYQSKQESKLHKRVELPVCTILLISINLLIWCTLTFLDLNNEAIRSFGDNTIQVFRHGEYYRMLTSMFLHGSITHVGYNCFSLYLFGAKAERYYGPLPFLAVYFFSGICGSLLSLLFSSGGYSIGASGAVYGVIASVLALCVCNNKKIDGLSYFDMLILILFGLSYGVYTPNIDNWAHIGGILSGFILSFFYLQLQKKK